MSQAGVFVSLILKSALGLWISSHQPPFCLLFTWTSVPFNNSIMFNGIRNELFDRKSRNYRLADFPTRKPLILLSEK